MDMKLYDYIELLDRCDVNIEDRDSVEAFVSTLDPEEFKYLSNDFKHYLFSAMEA